MYSSAITFTGRSSIQSLGNLSLNDTGFQPKKHWIFVLVQNHYHFLLSCPSGIAGMPGLALVFGTVVVGFIIFIASSLYLQCRINAEFFRKLGVPFVANIPFVGAFVPYLWKGFTVYDEENVRKYGQIYGQMEQTAKVLVVSDAHIVEQVLVKQFYNFVNRRDSPIRIPPPFDKAIVGVRDADWKRARCIMSPTFSTGKIKGMIPHILHCCQELQSNLLTAADEDKEIEMKEYFGCYTTDVIARTAFGLEINSQKDPDCDFVRHVKGFFIFVSPLKLGMIFSAFFPRLATFLTTRFGIQFTDTACVDYFRSIVRGALKERDNNTTISNEGVDFLQLLKCAKISDDDKEKLSAHGDKLSRKAMTEEEILANSCLFLLAGYETTATQLIFAAQLLTTNPEWQEKAYREVLRESKEDGLTYESIGRMKLLERILLETLRLYTPVFRLEREAASDIVLGGMNIPAKTVISIPAHAIHHNPEIYPDPETFNPDRFLPDADPPIRDAFYLPFGQGPRDCIGKRLAQIEAKMALAQVLLKLRFVPCDKTELKPVLNVRSFMLAAKNGVWLKAKRRADD